MFFFLLLDELKLIKAISNTIMTDNNINISKLPIPSHIHRRPISHLANVAEIRPREHDSTCITHSGNEKTT